MTDEEWAQIEPFATRENESYQAWHNSQTANVYSADARRRIEIAMAGERLKMEWEAARKAYRAAQIKVLGRVLD